MQKISMKLKKPLHITSSENDNISKLCIYGSKA